MDEVGGLKKFVSSDELDEARRVRQEEWERVRKPEDPVEAPEEKYDSRCLYDKLEQQKQKKQDELDEKHRLSNQVKVLDDDEADFLDLVSEKQAEIKRRRDAEDKEVLTEYRLAMMNQVNPAPDTSATSSTKPQSSTHKPSPSTKKSQMSLLAGAIKRKSVDVSSVESTEKKAKSESSRTEADAADPASNPSSPRDSAQESDEPIRSQKTAYVIGVLPGLAAYSGSSDSDSSSDSEIELPPDIFQCKKIILAQVHSH